MARYQGEPIATRIDKTPSSPLIAGLLVNGPPLMTQRWRRSSRVRHLAIGVAGAASVACGGAPAFAQVAFPDSGLNLDLGGAMRLRPKHLGSDEYQVDVVPIIQGQYGDKLHFSLDDGIQYDLVKAGPFKFGPDLEYRQPYDNDLAPRSNRTSNAFEVGVFAKINLVYAELEARFRKAVDGYDGYSGDISLDTLVPLQSKLSLGLEARVGWADRKFALDQFGSHGLPPGPGAPAPPTNGSIGDYYSAGAQAALIYQWTRRTKFILSVSDDVILRPSRPQSGADTRNAATVLLAVARRFSW